MTYRGGYRHKISVISAISLSPKRQHLGLYMGFYPKQNIATGEVIAFVRGLLRHLRGAVILLWDRSLPHRARRTWRELGPYRHRLDIQYLPPYAPDLNPDEWVWTNLKYHQMANHGLLSLEALQAQLQDRAAPLSRNQPFLWSCIQASKLPLRKP